jgi:hypothetical protein
VRLRLALRMTLISMDAHAERQNHLTDNRQR